ncbi:MAG: enoyl-CoA hydratase/isomerase family protein [Deltaproteobacteria bacterium]|nr:enoyl-CoA hydratase/isomerase family protein [Deltaproteobacteria bacterium]
MIYNFLNFRQKDHVAIAELNDPLPKDRDLLDLAYEFSDLCSTIGSNDEIFVLALVSEGRNSLNFIDERQEKFRHNEIFGTEIPSITESISGLEIPVIIGVSGNVSGQGLELALACDIRIAAKGSKFWLPHIGMGIIPFEGGTQRLPRIAGTGMALEMMLTCDTLDAQTAYRLGIISRIVKKKELGPTVEKIAGDMSGKSPIALNYIKEAVTKGMDFPLNQGLRLEADLYFLIHSTHDRYEGIKAFQQKRKPIFRGE